MSTFDSKASGRAAFRSVVKALGNAAALSILENTITESPRAQLNAYGAGRRTLEQQPWVHLRNGVRELRKVACTRADRKAGNDVKVTGEQRRTVEALVKQFDPEVIMNMLTQIFDDHDLTEFSEACESAVERLHTRRAKFMPSETAQKLGITTVLPETEKTEKKPRARKEPTPTPTPAAPQG